MLRGRGRIAVLGRGSAVASKRMRAMWVGVRGSERERKRERERENPQIGPPIGSP